MRLIWLGQIETVNRAHAAKVKMYIADIKNYEKYVIIVHINMQ